MPQCLGHAKQFCLCLLSPYYIWDTKKKKCVWRNHKELPIFDHSDLKQKEISHSSPLSSSPWGSSTRNYSERVGNPPWIFKVLGYAKFWLKCFFPSKSSISVWGFCWALGQFFPHDRGRDILREVSHDVRREENHSLSLNQVQGPSSPPGSVTPCVSTRMWAIPTRREAVWREKLYLSCTISRRPSVSAEGGHPWMNLIGRNLLDEAQLFSPLEMKVLETDRELNRPFTWKTEGGVKQTTECLII